MTLNRKVQCNNSRCAKIVPITYFYMFRCVMIDASGQTIEVAFARDFAKVLMKGIEPAEFKRMFTL